MTAACAAMRREVFFDVGGLHRAAAAQLQRRRPLLQDRARRAAASSWVANSRALPLRVADPRRAPSSRGSGTSSSVVGASPTATSSRLRRRPSPMIDPHRMIDAQLAARRPWPARRRPTDGQPGQPRSTTSRRPERPVTLQAFPTPRSRLRSDGRLGRGLWRSAGRSIRRHEAMASTHTTGVATTRMIAHGLGSVAGHLDDRLLHGERPDVDAVRRVAEADERPRPPAGRA